jgi:DNA primase
LKVPDLIAYMDTVQQIKERLSIIEVITPYVKLTKAGKYHRGLSPFGKEKTPSFYVNPERGTYYCFSTSQGGDHFEFIQRMEGIDFKGALKMLAEKAGVIIEYSSGGVRDVEKGKQEKIKEITARAQNFFSSELNTETSAYAYAKQRGLKDETIRRWSLGYAPGGWRVLYEHLIGLGYTSAELLSAGVIKEADEKPGTYYDRFRNRLMFPISDLSGNTVAFTGRALESTDAAKYLNSPETDIFKKSNVLFGMDKARDAIRTRGFAILVEGQFDLILLHQTGFTNTIALSGTAFSDKHLEMIRRYSENLMLCLDSDRAGLQASAKNAHAALLAGMRVKAIALPKGKDPADIVSEDPKMFSAYVSNAQSIIEFFLTILSRDQTDESKLLQEVERIVLPLVCAVKSPLERNRYVEIIARSLSTTPEAVREALSNIINRANPERYYNDESVESGTLSTIHSTKLSTVESRKAHILGVCTLYKDTPLAKHLINEYARITGIEEDSEAVHADERTLFELGLLYGESPAKEAANDVLILFEKEFLMQERAEILLNLKKAEQSKNAHEVEKMTALFQEVVKKLAVFS